MRGHFRFASRSPGVAAPAYADALARLLRKARPRDLEVHGGRVFVRGGIFRFVSNWNLLVCVTSAMIEATPAEREVIVSYDIRLTELVVFCGVATLFGIPITFASGSLLPAVAWPILVWAWIFGMNWLLTRSRMISTFRMAAELIVQGETVSSAEGAG